MSATIRRTENVFTAPLEDTLLMMSVENGVYHGLNSVGARIWELLEQPTTEAAVIERLLAEFEVEPEICTAQVAAFLTGLRERGLLVDAG